MTPRSLYLSVGIFWSFVRSLSTDDAYDRYLAHHAAAHSGSPPLTRQAFYMKQQQQKWTAISRCC